MTKLNSRRLVYIILILFVILIFIARIQTTRNCVYCGSYCFSESILTHLFFEEEPIHDYCIDSYIESKQDEIQIFLVSPHE